MTSHYREVPRRVHPSPVAFGSCISFSYKSRCSLPYLFRGPHDRCHRMFLTRRLCGRDSRRDLLKSPRIAQSPISRPEPKHQRNYQHPTSGDVGDRCVNWPKCLSLFVLLLCTSCVFAQSGERVTKPAAVLELGGAGSWNVKAVSSSFGPDVAVEFTPIEKWLEIEVGVTPLFARHSTEWDTHVLFKKPWDLTRKAGADGRRWTSVGA